jgi:hypothetical protein
MSKFIVANLASALALITAGSVLAASTPDASPQARAAAAQTPPSASAPDPSKAPVAQKTAQAAKKKAPSPDEVLCKPDVGTGSRVGGAKICLTRAQWRERAMD